MTTGSIPVPEQVDSSLFRVGRSHGDRTLYYGDDLIGTLDPGWGVAVVALLAELASAR